MRRSTAPEYESSEASEEEEDVIDMLQKLPKESKMEIPFPKSTYGGMMLMCARITAPTALEDAGHGALVFEAVSAILIHVFTVSIQIGLITVLFLTTIEYKEDPYEGDLYGKRSQLDSAVSSGVSLHGSAGGSVAGQAEALCYRDQTVPLIHMLAILLWFCKMIPEFEDAVRNFQILRRIDTADATGSYNHDGKKAICQITRGAKITMMCFVPFMQFFIALFCMWCGGKLLVYRHTCLDLIIKLLCMVFVFSIDEFFYAAFTSLNIAQELESSTIVIKRSSKAFKCWDLHSGPLKLLITIILAVAFYRGLFYPVAEFRTSCWRYRCSFPKPSDLPYPGITWDGINGCDIF